MKLTRLAAHAHGPFAGEILTPAPGLTVVWGLNEAGKSSWHSAALLAITGLTRRRGRPPKSEQETIDRRKPRTGDRWQLEAGIHLDDGEDLIVTWDLNQRVATVLDSLGRDRSNQWMTDGAPDLARIVGLDRASFVATACVRQSDLQRVRDDAGLLQELLQQATTSADADATASAAIATIDQFRKEQVGLERENSTRPLMDAKRRVEASTRALHAAQTAHRDRLDLLAERTATRSELTACTERHQALRAALSIVQARLHHEQLVGKRHDLHVVARRVQSLTEQIQRLDGREQLLLAARTHAERVDATHGIEQQAAETAAARAVAEAAEQEHRTLRRHLAWLEHERARRSAQASRHRFERVAELHRRHPAPPPDPTDIDQLAHRAGVLLDRWQERPSLPVLIGPTTIELEQQLTDLGPAPGEVVPIGTSDPREAASADDPADAPRPAGIEQPVRAPADAPADAPRPTRTEQPVSAPADAPADAPRPAGAGPVAAGSTIRAFGALGFTLIGLTLGAVVHPALFSMAVVGVVAAVVILRRRFWTLDEESPELQQRLDRAEASEHSAHRAALTTQLEHRRADEQRLVDIEQMLDALAGNMATLSRAIGADPTVPVREQAHQIERWLIEQDGRRQRLRTAQTEWGELTNLLSGATLGELSREAAKDERHWNAQEAAVHSIDPLDESLQSIDGATLKDRIHHLTAATADAAQQSATLRLQVPDHDPLLALATARRAVEAARHELHGLGDSDSDSDTDQLAQCSIEELDAWLSACRHERVGRTQARDEAAGALRQLRAGGSSPRDVHRSQPLRQVRATGPTVRAPSTITPTAVDPMPRSTATVGFDLPSPSERAQVPTPEGHGDAAADPLEQAAAQIVHLEAAFSALPAHAAVGFTLHTLPSADELHSEIETASDREAQLQRLIAGLDGRLQERDEPGSIGDPAAAAERHQAAVDELARVRELAEVLDATRSLLETAEDRVHRDIAPRLNAAVDRWLPRIFGDRYTKVLIDPASLDVQVFSAGDARQVDLLSQGTAEQFYLLLRVALSETLTAASGESCPLLLDDITVNFDRERTVAALELLREVAGERQVIVFTQEEEVRSWARVNLSGSDALIELPGRVTD